MQVQARFHTISHRNTPISGSSNLRPKLFLSQVITFVPHFALNFATDLIYTTPPYFNEFDPVFTSESCFGDLFLNRFGYAIRILQKNCVRESAWPISVHFPVLK